MSKNTKPGLTKAAAKAITKHAAEDPTDPSGELDRGHLARIRSAEKAVSKHEQRLAELKESVALAKVNLREAVRDLREEIADGTGRLHFEGPGCQANGDVEAWRSVTLEELRIPAGIAKKLMDVGYETLGQLADLADAGRRLIDIPGISDKAAEKLEKRIEQWWEKNPLAKAAS